MIDSKATLKEKGLKHTRQRLDILNVLCNQHRPFSAAQIYDALDGRVDLATIYRTLHTLTREQVIYSELFAGEEHYYAAEKHHHHIFCTQCDRVACVPCDYTLPKIKGFNEIRHQASFSGICNTCT